jgi:hypothetical protein
MKVFYPIFALLFYLVCVPARADDALIKIALTDADAAPLISSLKLPPQGATAHQAFSVGDFTLSCDSVPASACEITLKAGAHDSKLPNGTLEYWVGSGDEGRELSSFFMPNSDDDFIFVSLDHRILISASPDTFYLKYDSEK